MEIYIAKSLFRHGCTLDKKSNIKLISHAYPAVHLNAFTAYQIKRFSHLGFG